MDERAKSDLGWCPYTATSRNPHGYVNQSSAPPNVPPRDRKDVLSLAPPKPFLNFHLSSPVAKFSPKSRGRPHSHLSWCHKLLISRVSHISSSTNSFTATVPARHVTLRANPRVRNPSQPSSLDKTFRKFRAHDTT
ncbi:hypothetical protein ACOMHN_029700 [Nucella lapillus]